jgi:hypothetical protein
MFNRERWLPLRQLPDEGAPGGEVADVGGEVPAPPSGPGSGRSDLRQQLEKNFETDRKAAEKQEAPAKGKGKTPKRVAGGAEVEPEAPVAAAEGAEAAPEAEAEAAPPQPTVAAPEGFSKEAKAEWAKTPPAVQAAVAKREADMAKGVEELKGKYKDIDTALQPHVEAIRRTGHSPAEAVSQLFAWFQALSGNPVAAFPALAKSFNMDLGAILQAAQSQQQPQPQQGQQPAGDVPPAMQKYINDMQQELGLLKQQFGQELTGLKSTFQQQSEAKTQEILTNWSKDKPHFEAVRGLMAQFIQSGAVPLKNGQVDLDGAYDMAIYASPDVRTQVLTAQQEAAKKAAAAKVEAERKAQQAQADKARKAGVSVGGGAPGVPGAPSGKPTGKRKTVRESIMEAREQLIE